MSERHPDDMRLAEWAEGLLPPDQTASVRAHLGECARCRTVEEDLVLLREELAHLNDDLRMPGDVAARLDLALSALPLIATVSGPGMAEPDGADGDAPGPRGVTRPEWLAGGGKIPGAGEPTPGEPDSNGAGSGEPETAPVSRETSRAPGDPSPTPSPDSPDAVSVRLDGEGPGAPVSIGAPDPSGHRGVRRRRPALVLAASAAILTLGAGGVLLPALLGNDTSELATDSSGAPREDSAEAAEAEATPDAREVGDRVRWLLLASREDTGLFSGSADDADPGADTETEDSLPEEGEARDGESAETGGTERFESEDFPLDPMEGAEEDLDTSDLTDEVPGCIRTAIGRGDDLLVAEENYDYGGTRTYLVVLPHGRNTRLVDAFIVDASCVTEATAADREDVLFETSFIRE
ncbi:anti-sigma factor [Streptomyces sp. ST2-7A]|uniref:anti-sigma factor family protein n=1 Tax=Streptomyces sp. ST2-7A TaxID=2907214 RepID=UPI001F42708D|nr:zf-HC2 domain-containing protein [Streptomyces sp. ST2-7A]MCE7081499.1 zf-HC2 domain-containing protein [Streptomyces sp. ST2-7A]